MKYAATAMLALGILTTISVAAGAAPITIDMGSFSGGTGVIHAPGTLADGLNVYLGAVVITGDLGTFESYCVDLMHYDSPGANQVTVDYMSNWSNTASPAHTGLGGGAASWLYNTYGTAAVGQQSLEAALSLAIWNALYDNDYTVLGGTGFYVTALSDATYGALADGMLGALATNVNPLPNDVWLRTQDSGTYYAQDLIAPPISTPEPPTVLLFGTGFLVASAGLRRRPAQKVTLV